MHNFAKASPRDPFIHGAERPGYREDDPSKYVPEWIAYMKNQGIERVVCLLDDRQLAYYEPSLIESYDAAFPIATVSVKIEDYSVPTDAHLRQALSALAEAFDNKQRVVVHCSAGMGRTGAILAAWLRYQHGLSTAHAVDLVMRYGMENDAYRNPLEAGRDIEAMLERISPRH